MDQEQLNPEDMRLSPSYEPCAPNNKHFTLTVSLTQLVRNSAENTLHNKYYVTAQGVCNSLREPQDGYVNIGRQQTTDTGLRPNDIILPACDRAVSRVHCKINARPFFEIPGEWLALCMATHPRLGRHSPFLNLPTALLRCILLFLTELRAPELFDSRSMYGTYVKVSNSAPVELQSGLVFLVGSDILIQLEKVVNEPVPESLNSDMTVEDFTENNPLAEDLGPYILIRISRYPSDNEETLQPNCWKFPVEDKYKQFTVGRSQLCDIYLHENTISRTQCRVVYDQGRWLLYDGLDNKPTINGTWLSICRMYRDLRELAEPYRLRSGDQIKVSDSVLEISY